MDVEAARAPASTVQSPSANPQEDGCTGGLVPSKEGVRTRWPAEWDEYK